MAREKPKQTTPVFVKLPSELVTAVRAQAEKERRTLKAWLQCAIEQRLKRQGRA